LTLADIPIIDVGGTLYRQFLLDINQNNCGGCNLLSLNQVQIFQSASVPAAGAYTLTEPPDQTFPIIGFGDGFTEVFRMSDPDAGHEVKLNFNLNPGSGGGDMFLYVLNSQFNIANGSTVTFFSQFGQPPGGFQANDGIEEWATLKSLSQCVPTETDPNPCDLTPVPEPASLLLLGGGLGLIARRIRRSRRNA
jgi:hypothetical protein